MPQCSTLNKDVYSVTDIVYSIILILVTHKGQTSFVHPVQLQYTSHSTHNLSCSLQDNTCLVFSSSVSNNTSDTFDVMRQKWRTVKSQQLRGIKGRTASIMTIRQLEVFREDIPHAHFECQQTKLVVTHAWP